MVAFIYDATSKMKAKLFLYSSLLAVKFTPTMYGMLLTSSMMMIFKNNDSSDIMICLCSTNMLYLLSLLCIDNFFSIFIYC
jgi:hypothetical protein